VDIFSQILYDKTQDYVRRIASWLCWCDIVCS